MEEYPVIHIPPVIPLTQVNIRFTQIAASIYEARRLRGKQSADRGRNRETRLVHERARIPSRSFRSSKTILDRNSNETPFATRPRRIPPRPDIDSWRAPATRTKDVGIASSYGGLIKSKGDRSPWTITRTLPACRQVDSLHVRSIVVQERFRSRSRCQIRAGLKTRGDVTSVTHARLSRRL